MQPMVMRSSVYARDCASSFHQDNISPGSGKVAVSHLAYLFTSSDFPESMFSNHTAARCVLGEDTALQRPYPRLFR